MILKQDLILDHLWWLAIMKGVNWSKVDPVGNIELDSTHSRLVGQNSFDTVHAMYIYNLLYSSLESMYA